MANISDVNSYSGTSDNDLILGTNGRDTLAGAGGNDTLSGGEGDDYLYGGEGNDTLSGQAGEDTLIGGDGADYLDGGDGNDSLAGDGGNDLLRGYAGNDSLSGGDGNDTLEGGADNDLLEGGAGDDQLVAEAGADTIIGGDGNDYVDGGDGNDSLSGEVGNDYLRGYAGNDSLSGGDGNDTLEGGADNDLLEGGIGDDLLRGDAGNDVLSGGAGNDSIYAEAGDDYISGGDGDDYIEVGSGQDTVDGGAGYDIVSFTPTPAGLVITLAGSGEGTAVDENGVTDKLYNIENVRGSMHADVIVGSALAETLEGRDGNDTIDGNDGRDRVAFQRATAGVYVDLTAGFSKDHVDVLIGTGNDAASVGVDTFTNIERIEGSNYGDYLSAAGFGLTSGAGNISSSGELYNSLAGGVGNDTYAGNGATELLFNYSSALSGVVIDLQAGTAVSTWSGIDRILGGITLISATILADRIKGTNTNLGGETFALRAGDDTVEGGGGYDTVTYTYSASAISVDMAAGIAQGGADTGRDTLTGIEQIRGTAYADTYDASRYGLVASNGNRIDSSEGLSNSYEGMGGNDLITGNGVTRVSFSNASAGVWASLIEGYSKDLSDIQNNTNSDAAQIGIDRFSGVHALKGSDFNDVLIGGRSQSNFLETFDGRQGNDSIDGGAGFDRAVYHNAGLGAVFVVENGNASFAVDTAGAQIYTTGLAVNMAEGMVVGDANQVGVDQLRSVESITGTWLDDRYDASGFSANSLNAGSLGYFNEFRGYAGNDTIIGNGHTRLSVGSSMAGVFVNLATGESLDLSDKYNGTSADLAMIGIDSIQGGVNQLSGGGFGDVLIGGVASNDLLEVFIGHGGNDTLSGGSGFDRARYDNSGSVGAWYHDGSQLIQLEDGIVDSSFTFTQGVTVNLASGVVVGDTNYIGTDTLLGIESVFGTILADTYDATGFSGISENAGAYGTFNEFQGRGGDDRVIGNGNTRVSYVDSYAGVSVDLTIGTSSGLVVGDTAFVGIDTISGVNAVRGSAFGDVLIGSSQGDILEGMAGDDSITGGAGNDRIDGGAGRDTAVYAGDLSSVISIGRSADGLSVVIKTTNEGTDTLTNIENIQFGLASAMSVQEVQANARQTPVFSSVKVDVNAARSDGAESSEDSPMDGEGEVAQAVDTSLVFLMPEVYAGPVAGIDYELIDTTPDAVIVGSTFNDFIVMQGTGNKAVNGGGGDNVIDGGTGSTFITGGGVDGSDTFFLDGRATGTSWSTITDFELGLDKATIWGWKEGVSSVLAVDAEGGATGYTGLTLHFKNLLPDGASATDTNESLNSITLSGRTLADFGASSLGDLNAQIAAGTNSHFLVDQTVDAFGEHGYLLLS